MNFANFFRNIFKQNNDNNSRVIYLLNEKLSLNQQQLTKYINKFLQNEEKWKLINYLIKNINSTLEIEDLLKLICSQIMRLVSSDICSIYIYDQDTHKLVRKYTDNAYDCEEQKYMESFIKEKNIFVDKFINTNLEICSSSIKGYLNDNLDRKYHITPIITNQNFFGIIFLYKEFEYINDEEINILQIIAENIVMAIKNAELYQKVKESNRNKVEFIATLSHEFKTPLNTIIGFSEIMKTEDSVDHNQVKKYSDNIYNCSKHLLKLIEDIQDASIAESGNISLYYEKFNAKTVILDCLSQMEGLIKRKDIQISSILVDTIINADLKRFRQVIYNLFSNAIKFSNINGKISIISFLTNNNFQFEITNFGRTIDECEKNKLFNLFYQSNPSTQNHYEGAGIGLALCKKIIGLHNGDIDYASSREEGTTFWFSLPVAGVKPTLSEEDRKNFNNS